jgi:membrane protein
VGIAAVLGWKAATRPRPAERLPPERREPAQRRGVEGVAARRGREATGPSEIPAQGWKDIAWRVYQQFNEDRVMLVAAGVTFYALLAIFPALTAFVSIYGLFADPETAVEQADALGDLMPEGAVAIIGEQMQRVAEQPAGGLTLGFIFGLGVALWSANGGMKSIFEGLNVAYGEKETRSFVRLNLVALMFTLGAIAVAILAMAAIVVVPIVLAFVGLGGVAEAALQLARWPLLFVVIVVGLALLYRYGPSRIEAEWRWISPGSLMAALVWVVASLLFSWYVANFDAYNETYGSLGAAIAFMVWLWISAMIVLVGAELNAEMEHQTARDSTVGGRQPMGARGARMADELGEPASR